MSELEPYDLLKQKGWKFHEASQWWYHIGKGLGDFSMHAALKEEGYAVLHRFDETHFCIDCGAHRARVLTREVDFQCDGVPSPQSFEDREKYAWFERRIQELMDDTGEGWLFILGVDLEDEDAG